ncbi:efflux RND transporter periplasmic adaptor subunit [Thalassomonas haliotis]|uniref:Efflux RND transporter periplasmic adaptor subunit n=1 Tax=Thalassomonas haliotis TaxID=485448 RepID=A0ABY7VDT6_9GAMM|nr:efflux RND transporter periplasmic adaptor subunit [Thalassomonas haliotis]WDE11840.1 efflux RND transporter periplasmic adaptor subunit [Thalassomonas haliotis]
MKIIIYLFTFFSVLPVQGTESVVTYQLGEQKIKPATEFLGTVKSYKVAKTTTDVPGQINFIKELGDRVKKGELITQLSDKKLQLEIDHYQAKRHQDESQLKHIEARLAATSELSAKSYSSELELDRLLTDKLVLQQKLIQIDASIDILKSKIENLKIYAPFDGVVTRQLHIAGEYIEENEPVLVLNSSDIEVRTVMTAEQAHHLKYDQKILIKDGAQTTLSSVNRMYPINQTHAGLVSVHLLPESSFSIGQQVKVIVPIQYKQPIVLVHEDAIRIEKGGYSVVKVDSSQKADVIPVNLIDHYKEWAVIVAPIKEGDTLVVRGNENLHQGDGIKVIKNLTHIN